MKIPFCRAKWASNALLTFSKTFAPNCLDRLPEEKTMSMDRRTFLGTMTAATVLSSRLSWAADEHKIDKIGLQLYTVRDAMKKDMEGTIAKVAQTGYKEVEF